MLKLGIYKKSQLTPRNLGCQQEMASEIRYIHGFFKSRQSIALDLYNSLDEFRFAESEILQEPMLARLSLDNGSLKYTHSRRFDEFNRLALKVIKTTFTSPLALRIHDIGASDGRTSCNLYDHLRNLYGDRIDFLASDYAPYLYVVKRIHSSRRIILDDRDNITDHYTAIRIHRSPS